jgi:hypothetical protein
MTSHKADSSAQPQVGRCRILSFSVRASWTDTYIHTQEDTLAGNTEFNLVRFDIAVDDVVDRLYAPLSIDHIAD